MSQDSTEGLTRGQRAAQTRARNKAAAEAASQDQQQNAVDSWTTDLKGMIPLPQVMNFLSSIDDIESYVYGDVQEGTVIVSKIAGRNIIAVYDGDQWHLGTEE